MNLQSKKKELIDLLRNYLSGKATLIELNSFANDVIDYFTVTEKNQLPLSQRFEKEFWYVIWQIQHLADVEHENVGVTAREFSKALDYLEGKKKMPDNFVGKRPK